MFKVLKKFIVYFVIIWLLSSVAIGLLYSFRIFWVKDVFYSTLSLSSLLMLINFVCDYLKIK